MCTPKTILGDVLFHPDRSIRNAYSLQVLSWIQTHHSKASGSRLQQRLPSKIPLHLLSSLPTYSSKSVHSHCVSSSISPFQPQALKFLSKPIQALPNSAKISFPSHFLAINPSPTPPLLSQGRRSVYSPFLLLYHTPLYVIYIYYKYLEVSVLVLLISSLRLPLTPSVASPSLRCLLSVGLRHVMILHSGFLAPVWRTHHFTRTRLRAINT